MGQREFDRVLNSHIHALRTRWRHHMSGITGQEYTAQLHRFANTNAQVEEIPLDEITAN